MSRAARLNDRQVEIVEALRKAGYTIHYPGGIEMPTVQEHLVQVAKLRQQKTEALAVLDRAIDALQKTPEWEERRDAEDDLRVLENKLAQAEPGLREVAERAYHEGTFARTPYIQIKTMTVLIYDKQKALVYAKANLPDALVLDVKAFEAWAKAKELDFVDKRQVPKPYIASDLHDLLEV